MRILGGSGTLAIALILPALAACTSQATVPAAPASPVPTKSAIGTALPATLAPAPAALSPQATSLSCFTRADLAAMTVQEIAGYASLCFDSEDGVQTMIEQAEEVEVVRAFLQDPTRQIAFREVTYMGNSPSGVLPVARFEDDRGISYLVAVVARKVLEMDPAASLPESAGPVLGQDELQAIAEELVRREFPAFDELRDRLSFQAGTKGGGVNFFRWEQPGAAQPGGMPPLAQVGITDRGEVFSYINTLYFLQ